MGGLATVGGEGGKRSSLKIKEEIIGVGCGKISYLLGLDCVADHLLYRLEQSVAIFGSMS